MVTPDWEQSKENAAPLQRGRNVAALEGKKLGLQSRSEDTERAIEHHESLVRPSEAPHVIESADDPLAHWLSYIKFYQDHFPSDTHQQFLLMERCTRALVKMEQYKDDDRFVGVCAKYADKTKEPGQVFKYLHQQKVGAHKALFWAAWAYVAEKDNDFPFAEQIYKKGISKNAQPLNTLKVRHKQFQRRMSRHWLNSSQQSDQLDDGGEEHTSSRTRGALGGLSHSRVRRNDRSQATAQNSIRRARGLNRPHQSTSLPRNGSNQNSQANSEGSFSIFVEQEAPQGGILDQMVVDNKRVIERQADRRKENTNDPERWNERGGIRTTVQRSNSRSGSRAAPPPFSVFVDEECASQHQREAEEKQVQAERQRKHRDERTFRERGEEGMAEKLARDPLRYVKDPSQLDADVTQKGKQVDEKKPMEKPSNHDKRSRIGFNKRLLKNAKAAEQNFEEARAVAGCFTISASSSDFNMLRANADQSSHMDLDEASTDMSMSQSVQSKMGSTASKPPQKIQRLDGRSKGRVLFTTEASFDHSVNQTAISTASSTVNEAEAVGVPTKKEEETINTKFAMRELSMMFSSPAFGVDDLAQKTEGRMEVRDQSMNIGRLEGAADVSFANVGDGLETSALDNSIVNAEPSSDEENNGPRNTFGRTTDEPGFDEMVLQPLMEVADADSALSCNAQGQNRFQQASQNDVLPTAPVELTANPGFQIFQDSNDGGMAEPPSIGFQIYEDNSYTGPTSQEGSSNDQPPVPHNAVQVGEEQGLFDCESQGRQSLMGTKCGESGDTASISLFGDAVAMLRDESSAHDEQDVPLGKDMGSTSEGETATISLFNEAFKETGQATHTSGGGFEIFVDEQEDSERECSTSEPGQNEQLSVSPHCPPLVFDYIRSHDRDLQEALRQVTSTSSVAVDCKASLVSMLSWRDAPVHLPSVSLPREFHKRSMSRNTEINVGNHFGVVDKELGRGAYGVVVLVDIGSQSGIDTVALKAQSPIGCLPWEYEVLRRIENRVESRRPSDYCFPRPLSFVLLSNGGMLSMTAASRSGLTLVDLVNVYKSKLGESVPELIALHYTIRMLRHVEILHSEGRIVHCDVKPDNFVLSSLQCEDNAYTDIDFSDLMLVDFGRAKDITQYSGASNPAAQVMFRGEACQDDMQCVAMRESRPWAFEADKYGIVACAHVLLFGNHIALRNGNKSRWYIRNRLKRYWQTDLWEDVFNTLLNVHEDNATSTSDMRSVRIKLEDYVKEKEGALRSLLRRQAPLLPPSRS